MPCLVRSSCDLPLLALALSLLLCSCSAIYVEGTGGNLTEAELLLSISQTSVLLSSDVTYSLMERAFLQGFVASATALGLGQRLQKLQSDLGGEAAYLQTEGDPDLIRQNHRYEHGSSLIQKLAVAALEKEQYPSSPLGPRVSAENSIRSVTDVFFRGADAASNATRELDLGLAALFPSWYSSIIRVIKGAGDATTDARLASGASSIPISHLPSVLGELAAVLVEGKLLKSADYPVALFPAIKAAISSVQAPLTREVRSIEESLGAPEFSSALEVFVMELSKSDLVV